MLSNLNIAQLKHVTKKVQSYWSRINQHKIKPGEMLFPMIHIKSRPKTLGKISNQHFENNVLM